MGWAARLVSTLLDIVSLRGRRSAIFNTLSLNALHA
jgi:hypothetical protein